MTGAELIVAERQRQIDGKGWTAEHDDEHAAGELTKAAEHYAMYASRQLSGYQPIDLGMPDAVSGRGSYYGWPWDPSWWKPSNDPIHNLVKAGALIAAEIDRLQREAGDGG